MTSEPPADDAVPPGEAARRVREAKALRDNLLRRKEQSRARARATPAETPKPGLPPDPA